MEGVYRGKDVRYGSFATFAFFWNVRFSPLATKKRGAIGPPRWGWDRLRSRDSSSRIPPKRNRKEVICFSPYLYRSRNLVERFFNKIKQCRRIATRYDRLAANYLAFIKLASIRIWLRVYESAS